MMKRKVVETVVEFKKTLWQKHPLSLFFSGFPKGTKDLETVLYDEQDNVSLVKCYPKGKIKRKKPLTIEPKVHEKFNSHLNFNYEERFVLAIKKGSVLLKEGYVVTPSGFLLDEINPRLGRKQSLLFHNLSIPKQKLMRGKIAVFPNTNNYYHWLFETIPRMLLLKKAGLKINRYIAGIDIGFKRETLTAVGINKKSIIPADNTLNILADTVIAPSMPIHTGNPTKEVCTFLRKHFLKKPSKSDLKKYAKIYVRRGNVATRRVSNEDEVIRYLNGNGFVPISFDGLTVERQSKIFNSAKVIVSFHGAALTNLVFCNKKAKVLEFFSPDYLNVCYWALSEIVGLKYAYFFASQNNSLIKRRGDVKVNIDKLKKSLDLLG